VAPSQVWAKYDRDVECDVSDGYYNRHEEIDLPGATVDARTEDMDMSIHRIPNRWGDEVIIDSARTVTIEADLGGADERTESVDMPAVTPCTPGHVRLFGNVARNVEQSIRAYAPRALIGG
jgi:hypothetical protein